ncbi:MAG: GNAT family N-acetyltransferase [Chloroflexota bacterium]
MGNQDNKVDVTIPANRSDVEGVRPTDLTRDLPQIVELLRKVFGETLDSDDRRWLQDANHGAMPDFLYRFNPAAARLANGFVWESGGRIVGNVTILPTKAWGRFLVANVAVDPNHRREGIARRLMQTVAESLRSRGGRTILLQVVKDNTAAIELYRSLEYQNVGTMTTWYATPSRIRQINNIEITGKLPEIRPLPDRLWRMAYQLDTACVPADLNWPDPLHPEVYHRTIWRRFSDFMNGRQMETWATVENHGRLSGLGNISGEWGRAHLLSLRIDPNWHGQLERPLLAKLLRRLTYLPRRNVRIDHSHDDEVVNELLIEANFYKQRILTHMRLDLVN